MKKDSIKVGFCVAYDWELLKISLPLVYDHSDVICLSLDEGRKSWGGRPYEFDNASFFEFVRETDRENKILVIEGNYSSTKLNSRQNCNLQRTDMADAMKPGGWHIQIDADEYMIDFEGFRKYLLQLNPYPTGEEKPYNVLVSFIPIFKNIGGKYYLVDFGKEIPESSPFATTKPLYERAKRNGYFNHLSPFFALHETWARGEKELRFKLANWGHASEELDTEEKRARYLDMWKELNDSNYSSIKNFHPVHPPNWPKLKAVEAASIRDLIGKMQGEKLPIGDFRRALYNSRLISKIKQITGNLT